ncbi:nitroreductase family protein [Candidatus Acetothermia bacterium]|nr:MAG: nitroreductase family protein [Candidatus Acetothermia bacterium]
MNQVLKAIRDRRSVRRFGPGEVSDHALAEILEAGRWAPSGKNTQPWRFVVVRSGEKRRALARLAPQDRMIATAPVTIAVLYDRTAGYDEFKDAQGIGAAIENILLAVHSLGLAGCWMGKVRDPEIEALLEAEDTEELAALIPIGRPGEAPIPPDRLPLAKLVRYI